MKVVFLCEECSALHKDPDAANKCKHELATTFSYASGEWLDRFDDKLPSVFELCFFLNDVIRMQRKY